MAPAVFFVHTLILGLLKLWVGPGTIATLLDIGWLPAILVTIYLIVWHGDSWVVALGQFIGRFYGVDEARPTPTASVERDPVTFAQRITATLQEDLVAPVDHER